MRIFLLHKERRKKHFFRRFWGCSFAQMHGIVIVHIILKFYFILFLIQPSQPTYFKIFLVHFLTLNSLETDCVANFRRQMPNKLQKIRVLDKIGSSKKGQYRSPRHSLRASKLGLTKSGMTASAFDKFPKMRRKTFHQLLNRITIFHNLKAFQQLFL